MYTKQLSPVEAGDGQQFITDEPLEVAPDLKAEREATDKAFAEIVSQIEDVTLSPEQENPKRVRGKEVVLDDWRSGLNDRDR